MDPIVVWGGHKLAGSLASAAGHYLLKLPKRNDEAFDKQRGELFEDWFLEFREQTLRRLEECAAYHDDLESRIAQRAEDPACPRVYANYARAADAEAIDERRRMLAFAAAGLVDTRLTVAQHARVERTLRELDPDDVLWLVVLSRTTGFHLGTYKESPGAIRHQVWLSTTACIFRHDGAGLGG
jgi:hypothetical protein